MKKPDSPARACGFTADTWPLLTLGGTNRVNGFCFSIFSRAVGFCFSIFSPAVARTYCPKAGREREGYVFYCFINILKGKINLGTSLHSPSAQTTVWGRPGRGGGRVEGVNGIRGGGGHPEYFQQYI